MAIRTPGFGIGLVGGSERLLKILLLLATPALGIVAGITASTGDLKLSALLGAGLAGLIVAALPRLLFWVTVTTGILVAGTARLYFPELQGVRWLVPMGAWLLAAYGIVYVCLSHLGGRTQQLDTPALTLWAIAAIAMLLFSGALHWSEFGIFFKGIKDYFQMWGLLFALAFFPWSEKTVDRLPYFFVGAALLQVPFALHQYIALVPQRADLGEGIVAVDIVAGTFGGQISGGGNNAVLSTFLMTVFAGLLSAWRQGVLSLSKMLVLGLPLLIPVALNVSKISIIYAAIVFVILFSSDVVRRPARFLGMAALFAAVVMVLSTAYTALAPKELQSWEELVEFTYQGNIERDQNLEGQLTRAGALRYWLEEQRKADITTTLFGWGPGTTRLEDEGDGDFVGGPVDPELKVGRLAVTALLWEGGVFALLAITGLFVSAFIAAGRLARACEDNAERRAVFHAAQVGVALLFVSLWHKHFFVFQLGFQTVFVIVFGYLAYWVRNGVVSTGWRESQTAIVAPK